MRVATWNLERKSTSSPRGAEALNYLHSRNADVMVVTETRTTFPIRGGHLMFGAESGPARYAPDERKIALWSAMPLEPVEFEVPLDSTRFLAARTNTDLGRVLVLAVCITWHMAEVMRPEGVKRKPWELHLAYLENLGAIIAELDEPFVVAGDFNQRVPRQKGGNLAAAAALDLAFEPVNIVTAGTPAGCTKPGIDHIAISPAFDATNVEGWPNNATGNRLSDHDGAVADLVLRSD